MGLRYPAGFVLALALAGCVSGPEPPNTPNPTPVSSAAATAFSCERAIAPSAATMSPPTNAGGNYAGPFYGTSEKLGESAPLDLLVSNMDRHNVTHILGYFFLEGEQQPDDLEPDEDLGYLLSAVQAAPGRIVPYFSPGFEASKARQRLGDPLLSEYRRAYESTVHAAGRALLDGIGELEVHDWGVPPDEARVQALYDFAASNDLAVMLHILPGQSAPLGRALAAHPSMHFLLHMYPEDLDEERVALIDLVLDHSNLYFTLNVDHMLFDEDAGTGLLYKYQDESLDEAVAGFVRDYDAKVDDLLQAARERYAPLIGAVPDRVVWGTEMNPRYNFEPPVFDRMMEFSRRFLGEFNETTQSLVAYRTALTLYGAGVRCEIGADDQT